MKRFSPLSFLLLGFLGSPLFAQPSRPVIGHEPPASVVAGQPLRVVARVSANEPLKEVSILVAQTGGAAPVVRPMKPAGAGVFVGQIEPEFFASLEDFRYYIVARGQSGAFTETNWSTVQVIGSGARTPQGEDSWQRPVLIGAGAAVAVGAGVALAGSGGGGGDSGGMDGDSDTDPADQVIVRTASDQVDEVSPLLPTGTFVDAADELNGRTIDRVRIRIEFDGVDGGEEAFRVNYNGVAVLTGETGGTLTRQVDVVGSASSIVEILVLSSTPVGGRSAYAWNATITYFVE